MITYFVSYTIAYFIKTFTLPTENSMTSVRSAGSFLSCWQTLVVSIVFFVKPHAVEKGMNEWLDGW